MSSRTMLSWGYAESPVGLFKTARDPKEEHEFVKAGPHGKALESAPAKGGKRYDAPKRAAAEVASDPLADSRDFVTAEEQPTEEERVTVAVFEEDGESVLGEEEIRRGIRLGEFGRFVDLTEQLDQIAEETQLDRMEVIGFIRREAVPRFRVKGSYYLGAEGDPKVLELLRWAIVSVARVAVVKWTKRTRQALGVIVSGPKGSLIVLELEWSQNVLRPGERCLTHVGTPLTDGEKEAAIELARAMFDQSAVLDEQEDDRVRLERVLVERAQAGKLEGFKVPTKPDAPETDALEQLLEASLELAAVAS